jgi:tetratricopeptide (TPR) repeat protein
MNINQKALDLLEKNEYEEALKLFQTAVEESRTVQSLTNLAWIYCYEEDNETAIQLLKEAIIMNSSSHFPYNLLGEIYARKGDWQNASDILIKAITLHPSIEAYNNLGVAKYHLGDIQEASNYFLKASRPSDYAMYSHVKCFIEIGKTTEAKQQLETFSEDDDALIGAIEVAELYVELGYFEQAIHWFERGWKSYWKQPDWISRFVYCLIKTGSKPRAEEIVIETIQEVKEQVEKLRQEECDEFWTESDKEERNKQLLYEVNEYEHMIERILTGNIPKLKFNTSLHTGCYLFGCNRHSNPEYHD